MRRISINKLLCRALTAILLFTASASSAFTTTEREFISKILNHYTLWNRVELNGKLHLAGLPVAPSLRIYMERDSKLLMSVRVPFMGEVGRLEVEGDSLLLVNKMNKVYVKESLAAARDKVPLSLEAIQDMFLARVYLLDYGTLSATNATMMTLSQEPDCWILLPLSQPAGGLVQYGYTMNFDGTIQALYGTTIADDYSALVEYDYKNRKSSAEFTVVTRRKTYNATLTLDEPKWNVRPMEPVEIRGNWQRVSLREFIKVLKII